MITCRICKEEKDEELFVSNKHKKNGKINLCKKCKSIKDKESYDRRVDKITAQKKEKIANFREEYNRLKEGKKCIKCGDDRFYVLDFHHISENGKDFNIGSMAWRSLNIEKIKKEADKCFIICSNCHREFHYLEKEFNITINEYVPVV